MFVQTVKDIGTVKVGKEVIIEFPYEDIYLIKEIKSSCDCGRVYNLSDKKIVQIKYIPKKIPKHLEHQGWYQATKSVTVTYKRFSNSPDEDKTTLVYTVKVVNK